MAANRPTRSGGAARKPGPRSRRSTKPGRGFRTFVMHAGDEQAAPAFAALSGSLPTFTRAADTGAEAVDPETAARGYLHEALASDAVPAFTAPEAEGAPDEFKSVGTETIPLTRTTTVKFRQMHNKVPVSSSRRASSPRCSTSH